MKQLQHLLYRHHKTEAQEPLTATPGQTATSLPQSSCENSILFTTSYSYIYDKPGGQFLDQHLHSRTTLHCVSEVTEGNNNSKYYIVINPVNGKQVAIADNEVTSIDPRSCFKLHADNFQEKWGIYIFLIVVIVWAVLKIHWMSFI